MKRTIEVLCVVVAAVCLLASTAAGQSFSGSILGIVRDASGAVVPQAAITVTNTGTNVRTEARSDAAGNYLVPNLPPGEYIMEVEAGGFKKFLQKGIILLVQQQARLDVELQVGALTESVSITADATLLESTTSSIGRVVDNRSILNLPLNSRNVYSLIYLTPGVTGSIGNNYNSLSYAVNGARASMMDTIIDGITASHPTVQGYTGISVFPSVDAIAEFKMQAQNYSAEFGRSAGSVLNVIYKSGTNQVHATAYEFLRNSVLDANNFFNNRQGQKLASFKRSQFGGMASGPIKKEKLFFMVSVESLRQLTYSSTTTSVPTLLERQGDFSQSFAANGQLIQIYDPFSTRANPSGSGFIRDALAGNRVPSSRFDPVAVNALKYFPLPNAAGDRTTNKNNYYNTGSAKLNYDNYDFRVDHNISARQRFFARYSHRLTESVPAVLWPKEVTVAESRIVEENHARNAVLDYSNTLSPTTILTARLGFARTRYVYNNQGLGFLPSNLGLPKYIDQAVDRQMFPSISPSGYASLGGGDHRYSPFNAYSALASITKIKGPHSLKYGFEGRLLRMNVWEARSAGTFGFGTGMTQGPDPNRASATAGNGLASLLLGTMTSGNLIQAWKNVASQSFYYAFYLQDDWRVTPKLTLNLGVRYDLDTPRTERYNRMNYFNPSIPSPLAMVVPQYPNLRGGVVFVGVNGASRHQYFWDLNNLAPRFGLAYQVTRRTVVRLGFANIFAPSPQQAHGTIGPFGFRTDTPVLNSLDGITPYNLLKNPFPQGFQPPPGAKEGLLTQTGANLQAPLQNTITPYAMQWNINIERELPSQVLLQVTYVGTRGLQLSRCDESGLSLNQLPTQLMLLGSALNQQVDNPFYASVGRGVLATPKIGQAQLLRPYPQFTDIIPMYSSGSSSSYHSLQLTAKKRFSHGLLFDSAFTWAKTIDNGMTHQDSYNIRADRTVADIDIAQRLVLSYVYELPFGRGRHFGGSSSRVVDALLGGWQVNGITSFQTGTPLQLTANNTAGIFSPKVRPNNNGKSGKLSGPVDQRLNKYFDTSVFSQPAPFTLGNLGERVPDLRNDGVRNFDLSIFKEFKPVERLRVQFRSEFLNAFNTPRFGGPTTGVTSASFGQINSQSNSPRQVQFGLKLLW